MHRYTQKDLFRDSESESGNLPSFIFKYMNPMGVKRFLETLCFRFTPPDVLNDPFEFLPTFYDSRPKNVGYEERWLKFLNKASIDGFPGCQQRLLSLLSDRLGLVSFSSSFDNILLWSHYADEFRGAAIAFKTEKLLASLAPDDYFLGEVKYQENRPIIDVYKLEDSGFEHSNAYWPDWREWLKLNPDVLFTKSKEWSYENEWRLIGITHDSVLPEMGRNQSWYRKLHFGADGRFNQRQLVQIDVGSIDHIILGGNRTRINSKEFSISEFGFEHEVIARIIQNERLSHVQVVHAAIDETKYRINVFDPNNKCDRNLYMSDPEREYYERGYGNLTVDMLTKYKWKKA